MKERILLIDGWNICLAQNAVANITDANSEPCGMYLTTINQIKNFIADFKPSKVFFILDGPNAGERRRKLFPDYKNKRRVTERKSKVVFKYDGEEEVDYEIDGAFERQLSKIYEFLKLVPVTVCIVPYCEADDVITYLAQKNQEQFNPIIISTDKDYLQLVNDNIQVYNWRTKVLYTKQKFIDSFSLLPENYIYKKVVRGDKSDNIKNTKSIGEKTFSELFLELSTKPLENIGDFFDYIDNMNLDSIAKKHHKHISLLKETKGDLLLKYKLMKLEYGNLKYHHIEVLKQQLEEQQHKRFSRMQVRLLMMKDCFHKLYPTGKFSIDKWMQPFMYPKPGIKVNC